MNICQRIVSQVGRRVDESSSICDARLLDGSRVNVIAPPLSLDGPTLTIRKFRKDKLTLDDLVRFGSISPAGAGCARPSSGAGALQRAHLRRHGLGQDDAAQLPDGGYRARRARYHLRRRGRTRAAAAPCRAARDAAANLEPGKVTMRDLVRTVCVCVPNASSWAKCAVPKRSILQAMNTGHDGSMERCTPTRPAKQSRVSNR